ncbi:MAG TPA: NTP transferase domain-containing protein, partial [Candidatus Sulfotelmatobacter sp.]|nr:NTP transferase domain-containing protein [Candidatus Sulfotelmatobacter sp.]
PKLLLPWGNTSILGQLIHQWHSLGARQIAVACAEADTVMQAELERLGFPAANRIVNATPERGMFSSIQCAARWPGWQATLTHWVIALGDQPHLGQGTLRALLELGARHPDKICQPARGGRRRHPVLLPKAAFQELAGCAAATLQEFLTAHEVALGEVNDPGLDLDIDQPEDYRRALDLNK